MADQNQRISDLLDTLTDASSEEIETALRIYEPADVAAVVAERALAGGGGSGGSSAAFYGAVSVFAESPNTFGGYSARPLDETESLQALTAVNVLQTITAGAGNGFGAFVNAPEFSAGTVEILAQLEVVNAAGTQKLALNAPNPGGHGPSLTSGEQYAPDFSTWAEGERIGSDLQVSGDGATVDSTVGGQFMAQMYVAFTTDSLT